MPVTSTNTSTVPALLKMQTLPVADRSVTALLNVIRFGNGFNVEALGLVSASHGYTVRNVSVVALTAVTFSTAPVSPVPIVQPPCPAAPVTCTSSV